MRNVVIRRACRAVGNDQMAEEELWGLLVLCLNADNEVINVYLLYRYNL